MNTAREKIVGHKTFLSSDGSRLLEPRMDGTTEQQLMWRVLALREALAEVLIADTQDGAWEMAKNGIDVDDYNASTMVGQPDNP